MEGKKPFTRAVLEAVDAAAEAKNLVLGMTRPEVLQHLLLGWKIGFGEASLNEVEARGKPEEDCGGEGSVEKGNVNVSLLAFPIQVVGDGQDDAEGRVLDDWGERVDAIEKLMLPLGADTGLPGGQVAEGRFGPHDGDGVNCLCISRKVLWLIIPDFMTDEGH